MTRTRVFAAVAAAMAAFALDVRIACAQQLPGLTVPAGGNDASQRAEVTQWIGPVKISIDYHSPAVHRRGRDRTGQVWGDLVPYGFFDDGHGPSTATPWRAGANETTTLTVSHDVTVNGQALKAGRYGIFLEVQKDAPWVWILSSQPDGWGSYQYDSKDDVLRVPTQPVDAPATEYLMYGFDNRLSDRTTAYLQWETKRVSFEIGVPNMVDVWVSQLRHDLRVWPAFDAENWRVAAQFCADRHVNLDEALTWADKALDVPFRGAGTIGRRDFMTLRTKASVLEAMGRQAEADKLTEEALAVPDTLPILLYAYTERLIGQKAGKAALDVATLNAKRHPQDLYWVHVGLARALTTVDDKAKAIAEWEIVLRNMPLSEQRSRPQFEATLKNLRTAR